MGKYKVGDWVVVSEGEHQTGRNDFVESMSRYIGCPTQIVEVVRDNFGYVLEIERCYQWDEDWLEPYVQPAISEDLPRAGTCTPIKKHNHYFKNVSHLEELDVYRLIDLYAIIDPCIQHMLKKCLVVGGRGSKDALRDVQDIIDTAERWKQMQQENALLST